MNGAEALLKTLVESEVEICFANPGTSEMQLVSAIGQTDAMRPVLCLFEGVVSGAADGYARMADKPAATLLHLGSGFSNSLANMHNARRAGSPIVNIVGDHASYHIQFDAPLTSDLPAITRWGSQWTEIAHSPEELSAAGARAVQASMKGSGQIATVIAPADHAWNEASEAAPALPKAEPLMVAGERVQRIADAISNGKKTVIMLGGMALREDNLAQLGAIADAHDVTLMCATFPTRLQRGAGRAVVQRLPYFAEQAADALEPFEQLILLGTAAPVSFFAYPGKEGWLTPEHCELLTLAEPSEDIDTTVAALLNALDIQDRAKTLHERQIHKVADDSLNPLTIGQIMSNEMPEHAVVSDEGATCGLAMFMCTENAPAHDWLTLTGGAIGQGLPVALGAALACPDRKVIALQADGSAMYTIQALWSMARENVDVTVVLLNNKSYAILNIELARVGAGEPNEKTLSMLDLSRPDMDFASMAKGLGVKASQARSSSEFQVQFAEAMATPGPCLIEAIL
ncbi:acetolactate synthase large subunit [Congregibacter litoralis]|uniref:Thiamine pyrophosphate-requiring enzyme n=1 Tax=Congregibacter litoralis KT71 TaxID=314285 RepID=A4A7Q3_9GAMM|nr:acetolactate synthase large subunit [Congregibacter litoralis]EAQ97698.1 Thiamine pyrophosphate-requiring enzyme [Congregibacter litoralis KT71]